jgi:DNA transformation protein
MDSYLEFVLERLSITGKVSGKAMFGGHGIYLGDLIFGLVVDGVLYLKVGELNIKDYIQAGMKPFTYEAKSGKPVSMSYWCLPLDILESNEDLPKWVNKSIQVAKSAKLTKPKKLPTGKPKVATSKKKSSLLKSKTTAPKKKMPVKKKATAGKKKPKKK